MGRNNSTLEQALRYSHIGLTMAVLGGVCFYAGLKLDDYLDWSPWGMLGGLAGGIIAGFIYFFLEISRLSDRLDSEEGRGDEERPD